MNSCVPVLYKLHALPHDTLSLHPDPNPKSAMAVKGFQIKGVRRSVVRLEVMSPKQCNTEKRLRKNPTCFSLRSS